MSRATGWPSNRASTTWPGWPALSASDQPAASAGQGKRARQPEANQRTTVGRGSNKSCRRGRVFIAGNGSFLRNLNRVEQAVETVQRRVLPQGRIQHLAQEINCIRNAAHALGQGGAAGVGMAAALKLLGHLER